MSDNGRIERLEDIKAWQYGRELTNKVYAVTKKPGFNRDYGLVDQIRRAAVSTMNNIAEGYERGSNKDFVRFLFIARGSAGEVRSLLYVALDQGYIADDEFEDICHSCVEVSKTLWGFIKSLRSKSG